VRLAADSVRLHNAATRRRQRDDRLEMGNAQVYVHVSFLRIGEASSGAIRQLPLSESNPHAIAGTTAILRHIAIANKHDATKNPRAADQQSFSSGCHRGARASTGSMARARPGLREHCGISGRRLNCLTGREAGSRAHSVLRIQSASFFRLSCNCARTSASATCSSSARSMHSIQTSLT
jgi:hypothetical protein